MGEEKHTTLTGMEVNILTVVNRTKKEVYQIAIKGKMNTHLNKVIRIQRTRETWIDG